MFVFHSRQEWKSRGSFMWLNCQLRWHLLRGLFWLLNLKGLSWPQFLHYCLYFFLALNIVWNSLTQSFGLWNKTYVKADSLSSLITSEFPRPLGLWFIGAHVTGKPCYLSKPCFLQQRCLKHCKLYFRYHNNVRSENMDHYFYSWEEDYRSSISFFKNIIRKILSCS